MLKSRAAFTLIELLIVIAIIATLGSVVVIVLNPAELLAQTRDSGRITDFKEITRAIGLVKVENADISLGSANAVYLSLPDVAANCSSYSLPELPSPFVYACATEANYKKTDESGWLPVDFQSMPGGSPLAVLPTDPVNNTDNYYSYVIQGENWAIRSQSFESLKFKPNIGNGITARDGGPSAYAIEAGSNLSLLSTSTPNILTNSNLNDITSGYAPGWDTALNLTYRPTNGFVSGYNSGVTNPAVGYHAHIDLTCGPDGTPCFYYPDLNTPYGYAHRWLGTSVGWTTPGTTLGWQLGTKLKIRFSFKADDLGKPARVGFYHWEGSSFTFGSAITDIYPTKINEWQEATYETTISSAWDLVGHNVSLYVYGHAGSEAQLWYDNFEVTYIK